FFFQAEDGIRDKLVTGVQTCALPICALYLIDHPEEVQDFNDYIDIDAWHVITNAERLGIDVKSSMGQERYRDAQKAYKKAEARFTRPGAKRARSRWAEKDLAQRAAEI